MMASAALQFGPASIVLTTQNAVGFVKEGFLLVCFRETAVSSRFRWRVTSPTLVISLGHECLDK